MTNNIHWNQTHRGGRTGWAKGERAGESRPKGEGEAYGASVDHRDGLMVKPEHLGLRMESGDK